MKHILSILLLLSAGLLTAQEYSYTITPELGDTTFTLDVVTENAANRFRIDRTTGLDTTALQAIQYNRIERIRQEQARLQIQLLEKQREAAVLLRSLNDRGLNGYIVYQRTKLDSFYVNSRGWLLRTSAGPDVELSTRYRAGNTTILRDATNADYAVILPISSNKIELLFLSDNTRIELNSNDGRLYRAETADGLRYTFRRL